MKKKIILYKRIDYEKVQFFYNLHIFVNNCYVFITLVDKEVLGFYNEAEREEEYMKTITFINEKGGIGKTSACFNIAWELSKRKKKVLLIDLDGQRANLTFFAGIKKTNQMKTTYDVLIQKESLKNVIIELKENLSIVPANSYLSGLPQNAPVLPLMKELHAIKDEYDYVFIDVNPTPNRCHAISFAVSDYAVILMLPDIASLEANIGIAESIEEIRFSGSKLKVLGIVFNRNDNRTNLSKEVHAVAQQFADTLETSVFDTKIRQAIVLSENVYEHKGITDYAPKSNAAKDYIALTDEFLKRLGDE